MDVVKSTSSLGKVSILCSIQELAMMLMSDHVSLMGSITNSSIEVVSWGDGCMDVLDFKNSSKGLGGEDVDLNMPHRFRAFISHLSSIILWLLLVTQFLQHLPEHFGDLASITFVVLEHANILVWKMNPRRACFSFLLHLWCNRGMHYHTCRQKVTMGAMGNIPYAWHLEMIGTIRKKMTLVARPK
jgi:hypothetical protein